MEYSTSKMVQAISNDVYELIEWNYPGIIGIESATSYWGLSTYNPSNCIIMINDNSAGDSGILVESSLPFFYAPNINQENVVYLSKNLRVTDKEQTVCDMVRYNRHEFHLFETLINAYDGMVDIERLETLARQYDILDKMRDLYNEALLTEDEG